MISRILFIVSLAIVLFSCEKGAGEGGNSTLTGTVMVEEWNKELTVKRSEHPARSEDVFIIYGDDDFYGDKVETQYDGTFKFEYLREGKYTVYVYSADTLNPADKTIVTATIDITDKNQTVTLSELKIISDNGDNGIYSFQGRVIKEQYSSNYESKRFEYPAQEVDVYIKHSDEDFYFDRVRTDGGGMYQFSNLIEGRYTIFTYSKDPTLSKGEMAVIELLDTIVSNQIVSDGLDARIFLEPDMIIKDNEGDKGESTIRGTVIMEEWNGDFTVRRDVYPAQDLDVYLMRSGDLFYIESVKTNYNGAYEFADLAPGDYQIFAYSKDKSIDYTITNKMIIVSAYVTITIDTGIVDATEIRVKN